MMGVLHETGHALYERGLPQAWARQPVGAASGMAAHESQSLIVEMQACRSDPFLGWLSGELVAAFNGSGPAWAPSNLARLWRRVERGFIRVDADEMTYPAHIILRTKLERAMVAGELAVPDLPGAWAEEMRRLLGITPPDDTLGCLQDIHWYEGMFGYFPAYTLGAMAAAQLMEAARAAVPELDRALAQGDLAPLTGWLRQHVHQTGSRLGFNELLQEVTGRRLDPAAFEAHLTARYFSYHLTRPGGSPGTPLEAGPPDLRLFGELFTNISRWAGCVSLSAATPYVELRWWNNEGKKGGCRVSMQHARERALAHALAHGDDVTAFLRSSTAVSTVSEREVQSAHWLEIC